MYYCMRIRTLVGLSVGPAVGTLLIDGDSEGINDGWLLGVFDRTTTSTVVVTSESIAGFCESLFKQHGVSFCM